MCTNLRSLSCLHSAVGAVNPDKSFPVHKEAGLQLPSGLSALTILSFLHLGCFSNNSTDKVRLSCMNQLPALRKLTINLQGNYIQLPEDFSTLTELEHLEIISHGELYLDNKFAWSALTSLHCLVLTGPVMLSDRPSLIGLATLPKLTRVKLDMFTPDQATVEQLVMLSCKLGQSRSVKARATEDYVLSTKTRICFDSELGTLICE